MTLAVGLGQALFVIVGIVEPFRRVAFGIGRADDQIAATGLGPEVDSTVQVAHDRHALALALAVNRIGQGVDLAS